ncbi:MAG TPA: dienelactone hydrolase family protein [Chloroflexota bacterium]|jgi:carboxymethylenebutenolidase|nr:dienelactone hydrolase family protein [Chloroflexota bacterium]
MWNSFRTDAKQGIAAELTTYPGGKGDQIHTYIAQPTGNDKRGGVVLVHHLPGWDELYQEFARRLANHGYTVICPDLYCRMGHGSPDDVAAKVRGEGGVADESVIADCEAAMKWLKSQPTSNGKVGIMGTCSGGRHSVLAASRVQGFNALVDCWGGGVIQSKEQLTPQQPVAPIDYTKDLNAPLLGLFGNDDQRPAPEQVNQHEEELKKHGKNYEFHRYDGAGHAFFYHDRGAYRQEQAMDGWAKVFTFLEKHLS